MKVLHKTLPALLVAALLLAMAPAAGAVSEDPSGQNVSSAAVVRPVQSIQLNETRVTVRPGKTLSLKAAIAPEAASQKKLHWTSDDPKVATVSAAGLVKGVKAGETVIRATATDGSGKTAASVIFVGKPVSKVKLNKGAITIRKGKRYRLKATCTPKTAAYAAVQWSSSNTKVATVKGNGLVKAKKSGKATITARARDGSNKKASCTVHVGKAITKVVLNRSHASIEKGSTLKLKASAKPKNAAYRKLAWSTSNKKVASVSQKGLVKGKKAGKATITVKAKDGSGKKATCKVKVTTAAGAKVQNLLTEAQKHLGRPYTWGGRHPSTGFDCSGYVLWCFNQSGAYSMNAYSAQSIYDISQKVSDPRPGDVVFFQGTYATSRLVTHVGIYVGDGQMIHCDTTRGVVYASATTGYWGQHLLGYGRFL